MSICDGLRRKQWRQPLSSPPIANSKTVSPIVKQAPCHPSEICTESRFLRMKAWRRIRRLHLTQARIENWFDWPGGFRKAGQTEDNQVCRRGNRRNGGLIYRASEIPGDSFYEWLSRRAFIWPAHRPL